GSDVMSEAKVNKSVLSFPVMFEKTEEVADLDTRFTKVKIWLMHLGENFNGSIFEKEVVDNAISTLGYIPIVGFIEENKSGEDDFSDHRYIITKDEKGVRRKYQGVAYGVITSNEDNNAHYEDRMCDDGETRTFLVVDGLLWNMFEDSSDIMCNDLIKNQSMELWDDGSSIDGYEDDDGLFHFTKFSFRAACILGSDYEPAMINSTVEVQFSMTDFVKNLQNELNDKYSTFTRLVNEKSNQGGMETMPNTDFAQTVLEQFSDISVIVSQYEAMVDRWGDSVPRFYLQDIQDNEIIVVDRKDNYHYYGYQFAMNGDKAEIDFTNGNRKKIRYENYEEDNTAPEGSFNFGKHIADIEEAAFAKVNEANAKIETAEQAKSEAETNYTQIKADYDEIKPKYDEYVQADEQRQAAELDAQKEAKFAEYEDDLAENADFIALKERKGEMSVDEIDKECAVLYVKVNRTKANFSKTSATSTIVDVINDSDVDDGFVHTKYGNIPVRR
ncbi:MAG: hypothetical protein IJD87_05780, partial [Turicibacter sp.]|nr:hypothetical protein [Turicibacter sp.]